MFQEKYTTGQFAKLCNTTKATLMTYEKKGILFPEIIDKNGYRYYSKSQGYDFYVIKALQLVGASLSETKMLTKSKDKEHILSFLKSNLSELERKQFELFSTQKLVEQMITQAETMKFCNEEIQIKYCPREFFISFSEEYDSSRKNEYLYSFDATKKLTEYLIEKGYYSNQFYESVFHINKEHFENNIFHISSYCYKLPFKTNDPFLLTKEAGVYASMYFSGSWDGIYECQNEFKKTLCERGYKIASDCFLTNVTFSVIAGSIENITRMFSVKIEK